MAKGNYTNVNIMFWNLKQNDATFPLIAELIRQFEVVIFVFAEFPADNEFKLQSKIPDGYRFQELPTNKSKIKFIYSSRVSMSALGEVPQGRGMMLTVCPKDYETFNLVGCHLLDPVNHLDDDRYEFARNLSEFIRECEKRVDNNRTIVIGDFNMNPFEKGMVAVFALNAVMDWHVALRNSRKYKNIEYPFFFNPMWFFMGHPIHKNGTIYYHGSHSISYYWNLYDQVLIRPSLMRRFSHDDLKIVTQAGNASLLTKSKLVNKKFSDHLPLLITLKI